MGAGYSEASRNLTVGIVQLLYPEARLGRRGPATACGAHSTYLQARLGRRGPSPATACGAHSMGAPRVARGRRVDQPAPGPAVDRTVGADRVRPRQALHRPRDLPGLKAEETRELALGREDGAARVALDHAGDGGLARQPPSRRDLVRQPRLEQVPAVGECRIVALLALDQPEPLLELRHRALELPRLRGLQHEDVPAELACVLRMLVDHRVHDPPGRVREPPGPVLDRVVARPLAAAHQRVERWEEI